MRKRHEQTQTSISKHSTTKSRSDADEPNLPPEPHTAYAHMAASSLCKAGWENAVKGQHLGLPECHDSAMQFPCERLCSSHIGHRCNSTPVMSPKVEVRIALLSLPRDGLQGHLRWQNVQGVRRAQPAP